MTKGQLASLTAGMAMILNLLRQQLKQKEEDQSEHYDTIVALIVLVLVLKIIASVICLSMAHQRQYFKKMNDNRTLKDDMKTLFGCYFQSLKCRQEGG